MHEISILTPYFHLKFKNIRHHYVLYIYIDPCWTETNQLHLNLIIMEWVFIISKC